MADGEISAEQRARISQNFRAAKALLARKRPRDAFNFSNPSFGENGDFRTPVRFTNIKRVPLAEIPANVPSPFTIKESKSTNCKYENSLCNRRISFTDHESIDCSFRTPEKQPECSGINEPSTFCNLPGDDDNFNELILEEIDALCLQNLTKNSLRDDPNGSSHVKGQLDGKGKEEFNCHLEPITTNEILNAGAEQSSESKKIESVQDQLDDKGKGKFDCDLEPTTTIEILNAGVEQSSKSKKIESESMPEEYFKYLKSLNDRQQEAVCSDISIPIMIVAGPGSGKTSTMVGRVLMLLSEGIGASHTLAMTFTTAAASEMRERIGAVAGKAIAKELTISTFHSFSLQLCRSHAEKLGRTPEFLIYGHGQQRRAIIEAVRLLENGKGIQNHDSCKYGEDSGGDNFPQHLKDKSKKWQKFVIQAKASGKTPAECREMGDEIGAKVLGNYNVILRTCNALDYHDLISCSVKLLTDFPEVFNECQQSWKAIVVDEFQDTSAMQYSLLRILASHNCITIVGDDDQSIFSFNGADITGFDSFRADFPKHKEVRLNKNYRSTRCIIEAASSVIRNNLKRCRFENVFTDNSSGCKITLKECHNEDAQCAFVVDKILETGSDGLDAERSFGSVAILYRRQVTGKVFQTVFRDRRIPFNVHGVAFYRKKVVKAIMAMLRTTLPGADDCSYRQAFKALLPFDKEEKKRVIDHIDKISTMRKYGFLSAACDIFNAKISGTFKRSQLTRGRKVLFTLEMISKLAVREQSISAVITSVANMLPQKYLFEQQAVVNVDGGKLLNEDSDLRSVLQYLLDDVSDFLSTQFRARKERTDITAEEKGCLNVIKAFTDYITERERENFRSRRLENKDSVTLTTIHQSKGLEWDTVFIVKSNESEIPLLHEFSGIARENATSIEEERRLFYVAMTRAKKKLFILFVTVDSNWQMLQPSRFLKEIPEHLRDIQAELSVNDVMAKHQVISKETAQFAGGVIVGEQSFKADLGQRDSSYSENEEASKESKEALVAYNGNNFVRRFHVEDRGVVSHLFHQWARKQAFQEPKRLIDKVGFVIDEHLAVKKYKHKDVLRELKTCLRSEEAFRYAEYVLRWEQIPADKRAHLTREKQEHFQKQRVEKAMGSSAPTPKQIAFLRSLGCTVVPTSRLHASNLIEQYKSL